MLANNLKVLPMLNAPDQTSDPRKGGDYDDDDDDDDGVVGDEGVVVRGVGWYRQRVGCRFTWCLVGCGGRAGPEAVEGRGGDVDMGIRGPYV
ncbi:hypothetical protein Tco_1061819 [Tanacetum coccineum]